MGKNRNHVSLTPKSRFPHHAQQDGTTCGVACLRMIQEWLDGYAESEQAWADRAGCNEQGLTPTRLHRQLRRLAGDRAIVREVDRANWKRLPLEWTADRVYVVLIDWFYAGERGPANEAHYVVVHGFRKGRRFGGGRIAVALFEDPSDGPGPQHWSWAALLALETHRVFEVRKA